MNSTIRFKQANLYLSTLLVSQRQSQGIPKKQPTIRQNIYLEFPLNGWLFCQFIEFLQQIDHKISYFKKDCLILTQLEYKYKIIFMRIQKNKQNNDNAQCLFSPNDPSFHLFCQYQLMFQQYFFNIVFFSKNFSSYTYTLFIILNTQIIKPIFRNKCLIVPDLSFSQSLPDSNKVLDLLTLEYPYIFSIFNFHNFLTYNHFFKVTPLSQTSSVVLTQNNLERKNNKAYNFSVYFLRGNDPQLLSLDHQKEIANFISKDCLSSSLLIYNPAEAARKIKAWKAALPWIQPHYAIKSCPSMDLIKDLASHGAGMDCASKAEIQTSLQAGVNLDSIVYSNPIKNEKDLIWAEETGVKLTTADSIQQLMKIQTFAPNMGVLWRIAIKEEATDNLSTPFSGKFGDDLVGDQMIDARMKEIADMGVNLKGIHFHCGSGMHGSSGFGKAIKLARRCMEIGRLNGHEMHTLDIGGGFPASDLPQSTIDALKPTLNDPLNFRVIAEPGRHMSSRCFYLVTRILGMRIKNGKPCFHMNDSVYHSFNCTLMDGISFDDSDQFYSKVQNGNIDGISQLHNATIFGMTCDGMDIISKNLGVPIEVGVGDWFCFGGMGAYTHGSKSNFNGMNTTEETFKLSVPQESKMGPAESETGCEIEAFAFE